MRRLSISLDSLDPKKAEGTEATNPTMEVIEVVKRCPMLEELRVSVHRPIASSDVFTPSSIIEFCGCLSDALTTQSVKGTLRTLSLSLPFIINESSTGNSHIKSFFLTSS